MVLLHLIRVVSAMTTRRRIALAQLAVLAGAATATTGATLHNTPLLGTGTLAAAALPLALLPWRGTGKRRSTPDDCQPVDAAADVSSVPAG